MKNMTCAITIPNWHPARLNQFAGRHWSVGHRLKFQDRSMVMVYAKLHNTKLATVKRRVSLVIVLEPGKRRPDADAYWKSLLDALVSCGQLVDDGPKWCEIGSVTYERGERGSRIILEDMECTSSKSASPALATRSGIPGVRRTRRCRPRRKR